MTISLRPALTDIAHQLELDLPATQVDLLLAYMDLLNHWNETYNLTAVRSPADMLRQHLADCLAIAQPLKRWLGDAQGVRILDVGSGAGLPGIVVALVLPQTSVVCVDKVGKKVAFIRQAISELGLGNIRAEHSRVESLTSGTFNLIVCRAFSSLREFASLTRQHLAPDGAWLAMKGKQPDEEVTTLPHNVHVFHVEHLQVPGLNAQRCLVWMRLRQSA